ncbi:MAG: magnesium-translocating P-type ATPase [Candidatus Methanoplasma sp.]|nr:magnesium-translocating P-type ATPase [Candidatus Methanoplasma sp.]
MLGRKTIAKTATQAGSNKNLLSAAHKTPDDVLSEYGNTFDGFTEESVEASRDKYGRNVITKAKRTSVPVQLFGAFVSPFTMVLIVLAVISFVTERDIPTVSIITVMVVLSGTLRFIQEGRSNKAADKLSEMVETTIATYRGSSEYHEIPIDELVVGDVIRLVAGDMIPADVRILKARDLFVSQSSMTGESEPVEKFSKISEKLSKNPLDYDNLAFMGTTVVSGSAIAIVCSVGDSTIFGGIAKKLVAKKEPTSFEKGVSSVSWVFIRFMLVMVPIVLFINGFTKGDWTQALMFALSVAIGLTPEMLPLIVSTNLAKGAVSMSKKDVIVKDLNSIQNFGAMDILCTDKTGTLTYDKIILELHLNINGDEDLRVLRHAYLNSYYQTGLKTQMDIAIIERAIAENLSNVFEKYKKVDEIPFDFNRRRMSVVVSDGKGKTQLITKGAIEEMLMICSDAEYKGVLEPMTNSLKEEIMKKVNGYNRGGMRVLGLAHKNNPPSAGTFNSDDETGMTLIGYLAFLDPPKKSAAEAIRSLNEYGVGVKVLTGDNDAVTKCICQHIGILSETVTLGSDIENMDDKTLSEVVERSDVFAKLSPDQKSRIVTTLRKNGHTVGFMGDGINDATAMKAADVGISVDTAVDIAKESANIILLKKDLMVLEKGVIEGRIIYANTIKYIKMTASSNFGNMFSVLVASVFLPFLPMLAIQILMLNLIYDISCIVIPWDNVDKEYLKVPRKWDASSISRFMLWIGPTSSVFDITTYILLFFVVCPAAIGGAYGAIGAEQQAAFAVLFTTGWFVESLWTQMFVVHMIRTPKIPFLQSRASLPLLLGTTIGITVGTVIPYTAVGDALNMSPLPGMFYPLLLLTILGYMVLVTIVKRQFVRRYSELL